MRRLGLSLAFALLSAVMSFGQNFQLPTPPTSVTDIPQRASYVVAHYWDNADFAALSSSELEQAFVNYLSVFPLTESDSTCSVSASALMHRADSLGGNAAENVLSLAEKYLFNGDSPMVQEEYFSGFVSAAAECRNISSYQRDRLHFWAIVIDSNRKGKEIARFRFRTAEGKLMNFDQIKGKRLLLLYDPDCKDCIKMIDRLQSTDLDCTVIAIAVNCTKDRFRSFAPGLPDNWIKGWDSTGTINGSAFLIRHLPDLYLVDKEGIILQKHSAALPLND